jgi:hypothetical protein
MKTAMQELRDDLAQIFHDNKIPLYLDIGKYLEKEKEQIADAFNKGKDSDYIHYEDWYNQTYNQNK